jgi:hypothetical protein
MPTPKDTPKDNTPCLSCSVDKTNRREYRTSGKLPQIDNLMKDSPGTALVLDNTISPLLLLLLHLPSLLPI